MPLPDDYRGANLVLVVGCPRSGTTWLQRMLAAHPHVSTGQESHVFMHSVGPELRAWHRYVEAKARGGVGLGCYFTEAEFRRVINRFMLDLLGPIVGDLRPGQLFLEKTPGHALYMTEIAELLPEARFIHLLRDCRDVVASLLDASKSWASSWAPSDPGGAASMWVRHVRAVRESASQLPQERFLELRYEQLLANPRERLGTIFEFLGLQASAEQCRLIVEANDAAAVKTGGGTQIPLQGEFGSMLNRFAQEPAGFVRKARSGGWTEDLSFRQKVAVWRCAQEEMAEAGYSWRFPWRRS